MKKSLTLFFISVLVFVSLVSCSIDSNVEVKEVKTETKAQLCDVVFKTDKTKSIGVSIDTDFDTVGADNFFWQYKAEKKDALEKVGETLDYTSFTNAPGASGEGVGTVKGLSEGKWQFSLKAFIDASFTKEVFYGVSEVFVVSPTEPNEVTVKLRRTKDGSGFLTISPDLKISDKIKVTYVYKDSTYDEDSVVVSEIEANLIELSGTDLTQTAEFEAVIYKDDGTEVTSFTSLSDASLYELEAGVYTVRISFFTTKGRFFNELNVEIKPNTVSTIVNREEKDDPEGINSKRLRLLGPFTLASTGKTVYFSPGNLQYKASDKTWQFAENQWDFVGKAAGNTTTDTNVRATQEDLIDLFGWATSGVTAGYKKPYDIEGEASEYKTTNTNSVDEVLEDEFDWGFNTDFLKKDDSGRTIHIGGWRVLSLDEWNDIKSVMHKCTVDGTKGLVLLPDNFSCPAGVADPTSGSATYTLLDWCKLEDVGCVFLPEAGYREGATVTADVVRYWASDIDSSSDGSVAGCFGGSDSVTELKRNFGASVRLVRELAK